MKFETKQYFKDDDTDVYFYKQNNTNTRYTLCIVIISTLASPRAWCLLQYRAFTLMDLPAVLNYYIYLVLQSVCLWNFKLLKYLRLIFLIFSNFKVRISKFNLGIFNFKVNFFNLTVGISSFNLLKNVLFQIVWTYFL